MATTRPMILLVDDDPLVRATLAMQLDRGGFAVIAASDGSEAQACCRLAHPDIAVIDFRLPGLSGTQLLRELRKIAPIPCIILTGSVEAEVARQALESGALACLRKPVDSARLVTILSGILDSRVSGASPTEPL